MTELSRLDPLGLRSTAELLARRARALPGQRPSRLSKELVQLASDAKERSEWIARPNHRPLRARAWPWWRAHPGGSLFAVAAL
ncbi:MAG: hypothetical protein IPN77_30755 [Sandaracinaceae bacterium]|nr:hypothetical protein [Sandaracinaceae bacterium]